MAKARTKYDVTIDSWENIGTDEEVWHSSDFKNVNKIVMLAIIDLYETRKYDKVIFVVTKHIDKARESLLHNDGDQG